MAGVSWSEIAGSDSTWVSASDSTALPWADNTTSNTTARNTSRFILHTGIDSVISCYVNLIPFITARTGFLIITSDPIALQSSGDSVI